ncbi:integrase, catalytic region, zinc finger, CCHC-type containing protein [Tanacetum coccineum]|uniref:Integrase, catalytic region, zinc finger, CCHC-type containing protein n=1 Tax=Tanacetum coccineum TaxID=301880 RepID=A0ABQ5AWH8_9ASTR
MSKKAKDPKVIAKKISHKPIDYENLNSLTNDFEKHFSPQQELSAEQAFWFHTLNPTIEPSYTPPVIVDVPSELPKSDLLVIAIKATRNKKNDRISQTPSRNKKNKVEAQPRKVNKLNRVVKPVCDVDVKHSLSNVNSEILCASCNKSMLSRLFGNDQIARIMGYGDYQLGNIIISRVYYVEGLGHNLFSVGHFCDADLEVAFRKNTCFIHNLEGVDLLSGSRDTNLYTISLDDMLKSSLICLLSKASKTKSWLWHRRLSHLNFDTLNKLAKDGLA